MDKRYCCLLIVLFLNVFIRAVASDSTFNILFIQSYTSQGSWNDDLIQGLRNGFDKGGVKVNITTEYLDADFWNSNSEKVIMRRFCERARERQTDLIVTVSDEALYTLLVCGDSLSFQLPVVFFGVKYPDKELLATHPNVCGFTSNPDFEAILYHAQKLFPERKDIACLIDNSFLSNKGCEDFEEDWKIFQKNNPGYKMKIYNTQNQSISHILSAICYSHNSYDRIVVAPKWSPFLSFVGKNSKAPVFSCQNVGLTNGVFCAYDSEAYASAFMAGQRASLILKGVTTPRYVGVTESNQTFIYDYKQLDFFHINADKAIIAGGIIVNEPYWEKYKFLFLLFYSSILSLLIVSIVWLMRTNRRESKKRIQAQTRLLVQNKLVEQRNEFDNVFHSIRDGVVTYDTNLHIHFTNYSLLRMLGLPYESGGRFYEGMMAGSIFNIYNDGRDVLQKMLKQVAYTGKSVQIPQGSFMKDVRSDNYFPVSGEIVPIYSKKEITGMALSARNISDEDMQKRFFDMALEESSIYPWQFDMKNNCFIFPQGFLVRFGYDESATIISREEMERTIHPEDLKEIAPQFNKVLTGESKVSRLNFRQHNKNGEYEWWEFRSSAISGLTQDSLYSILGVCQNVQRYKTAEQNMREARDKALQADKLKSVFLANMSHEIRTPLNAIVGFSDLLSDTSEFTEEERSLFVATINKNCTLLLSLINDILDLSRIESGTMEFMFAEHNLPLLLKTVHDSQRLNMPAGVKLVLRMPPNDKKYLKTDSVRLQQVVNNLINNAAKFTSSGSITFGYEEDETPGYTRIFVEDTGVGISEEGIRHIFERFYKVDNFTQGAGLGLSICQTIVDRLKGTISVTSEVGKGTRFTVRLPNDCE